MSSGYSCRLSKKLATYRWSLSSVVERLIGKITSLIESFSEKLDAFERIFAELAPERQLERGFALVRNVKNSFITKSSGIEPADLLEIEFADGRVKAIVDSKEKI